MSVTEMRSDVDEVTRQDDGAVIRKEAEGRQRHETEIKQKRTRDEGEFLRLSRRNTLLSRSFTADHQRERASLQAPLMELYATLNPTSIYKWDDDFDVVTRAGRRAR